MSRRPSNAVSPAVDMMVVQAALPGVSHTVALCRQLGTVPYVGDAPSRIGTAPLRKLAYLGPWTA